MRLTHVRGTRRFAVGLVALMIVAGCDSTGAAPATTGAAGIAEPVPAERWTSVTDEDTGVSFAMPDNPYKESRAGNEDGTTPAVTKYEVEIDSGLLMSVSFTEAAAADYSAEGLDWVADSLVEKLTANGAADTTITDRQPTTVGDRPALDFQLSFTARTRERNIWFVRFIGDGTRAVQLQSIASVAREDEASVAPVVKEYHRTLVESVRLP